MTDNCELQSNQRILQLGLGL